MSVITTYKEPGERTVAGRGLNDTLFDWIIIFTGQQRSSLYRLIDLRDYGTLFR